MTAPQFLSVAQALDTTWTVTAVVAWLTSAVALGAVLAQRWEDVREDALCLATAVPWRRSTGRHQHGGRHRADRLQGASPRTPEKLDTPPPKPAPKRGGAR